MALPFLPNELLLNICDQAEDKSTIFSLSLTCSFVSKHIRHRAFEHVTAGIRQGEVPKGGALHQPPIKPTDIRFLQQIRHITKPDIAPHIRSLEIVCYEFEVPTREFAHIKQLFYDVWRDATSLSIERLILNPHGSDIRRRDNASNCFFETIRGLFTFVSLPQIQALDIYSQSMYTWPTKFFCDHPDYGDIFCRSSDLNRLRCVQIHSTPFARGPEEPSCGRRGGMLHNGGESDILGSWLSTLTNMTDLSLVRLDVEWFRFDNLFLRAATLQRVELVHFKARYLALFLSRCKSLQSLVLETVGLHFVHYSWAKVFRCLMDLEDLTTIRLKQLHYSHYDPQYACNMTRRRVSELKHDLCSPRLEDYYAFLEIHREKDIELPVDMKVCPQIWSQIES